MQYAKHLTLREAALLIDAMNGSLNPRNLSTAHLLAVRCILDIWLCDGKDSFCNDTVSRVSNADWMNSRMFVECDEAACKEWN